MSQTTYIEARLKQGIFQFNFDDEQLCVQAHVQKINS